ncbi:hypothetical protein D3C72_1920700 [compost metagenome]
MFLLQFKFWWIRQIAHFTVDTGADVTLACQVLQRFRVLTFSVFNDRSQQHQAFALWLCQHVIHHLADGLRRQRHVMVRAARFTDPGKQQAQVVVNFSNSADR